MEIEILLKEPIAVQADGANETDVLYMNAPTPVMRKLRTRMIGTLLDAMLEAGKKFKGFGDDNEVSEQDSAKMDAEAIITMLYAADCGDAMTKMQEIFDRAVITPGIAFCHESKVPMNKDLWEKVGAEQDAVIAEYLANFISPALDTMITKRR